MRQPRRIREGYLGLFSLVGLVAFGVLAFWLSGGEFGEKTYTIKVKFDSANGLREGAGVNFRGVLVGSVARVTPRPNLIEVILRVNEKVKIPTGSVIEVNRSGLLGESSVAINPTEVVAKNSLDGLSPIGSTCDPQKIICDKSQVYGQSGSQLLANLARLTEVFANPVFLERVNKTLKNITELSEELAKTSKTLDKNLNQISGEAIKTARSLNKTAQDASEVSQNLNAILLENRDSLQQTIGQTKQTVVALNTVIKENRANLYQSILSVQKTSTNLNQLISEIQTTVKQASNTLRSPESARMLQNVNKIVANVAETSENLREASKTINDPKTILALQQTLQSARVTFENTQKITSDLDDLTGDPALRENIRRLITGLSSLVSSSDQLEQQVRLSQALESTRLSLQPLTSPSPSLTPLNP